MGLIFETKPLPANLRDSSQRLSKEAGAGVAEGCVCLFPEKSSAMLRRGSEPEGPIRKRDIQIVIHSVRKLITESLQ